MLSLIQKNLRPVQMCILCAVREELTYICRVCLTLSSVLVGREVILCFRQRRLAFRANKFGLSSVPVGREVILCFRQGRLAFRANKFGYPLFQAGKVSISC